MPFQKGNKPKNPPKKGEVRNPTGRNGSSNELSRLVLDTLKITPSSFQTKEIKAKCKEVHELINNLPEIRNIRVFQSYQVLNKCNEITGLVLTEIERKMRAVIAGEDTISPRDLSSMASSISAISRDNHKVIDENNRYQLDREAKLAKQTQDENMVDASQPTSHDLPMIHAD